MMNLGPIPGAMIDGVINLEPDGTYLPSLGNFTAKTYEADMTNLRIYDEFDFNGETSDPLGLLDAIRTYKFAYKKSDPPSTLDDNTLYIRIPRTLPSPFAPPLAWPMAETRNGRLRQDQDKLTNISVPGPLPLFGAAAAFGWSRRLRKQIKTTGSMSSSISD